MPNFGWGKQNIFVVRGNAREDMLGKYIGNIHTPQIIWYERKKQQRKIIIINSCHWVISINCSDFNKMTSLTLNISPWLPRYYIYEGDWPMFWEIDLAQYAYLLDVRKTAKNNLGLLIVSYFDVLLVENKLKGMIHTMPIPKWPPISLEFTFLLSN